MGRVLVAVAMMVCGVLGGCRLPSYATVNMDEVASAAEAGALHRDVGEQSAVLMAVVVKSGGSAPGKEGVGLMTVQPVDEAMRRVLLERLGTPLGAEVRVLSALDLAPEDAAVTAEELVELARRRGATWLLAASVDTQPGQLSGLVVVSLFTLFLMPVDVHAEGMADSALIDLESGRVLGRWTLHDSGWQPAIPWMYRMAQGQLESRTNGRMLRHIAKGAAEAAAAHDARFRESVAAARMRVDGWGVDAP